MRGAAAGGAAGRGQRRGLVDRHRPVRGGGVPVHPERREVEGVVDLVALVRGGRPAGLRAYLLGRRDCAGVGAPALEQHHRVLLLRGGRGVDVRDQAAGRMRPGPGDRDLLPVPQGGQLGHPDGDGTGVRDLVGAVDREAQA